MRSMRRRWSIVFSVADAIALLVVGSSTAQAPAGSSDDRRAASTRRG